MELEEMGVTALPRVLGGSSAKQKNTVLTLRCGSEQCGNTPTAALQLDNMLLIFNFRRNFYCKKK